MCFTSECSVEFLSEHDQAGNHPCSVGTVAYPHVVQIPLRHLDDFLKTYNNTIYSFVKNDHTANPKILLPDVSTLKGVRQPTGRYSYHT